MHPILARPGRLGAYLAIWVPLGALLAALLALQGAFAWTTAALVAIPLSIFYGFLCLSAWYVTGGSPVERVGPLRIGVTAIVSSFLSSAVWLLLVRGWLTVIAAAGLAGARGRIAVARELALAQRFLSIEQVRFGDRLTIDIDAGNAAAAEVPPLLVQPLVENAVTHGIAHLLEGGVVRIRAQRKVASLVLTVDNPCDADRPSGRGTGLGLRNVRARLESAYGTDAFLHTEEKDGRFVARIELPQPVLIDHA
jgi:hypothetical protein